jgi:uncharacterized protein (DUF2336 family)
MSEFQTATTIPASVQAAVAAKPRISADAFRNLTARLKSPGLEIPTVAPIAPPASVPQIIASVAPVIEPIVVPAVRPAELAAVEETLVPEPSVWPVAPIVETAIVIESPIPEPVIFAAKPLESAALDITPLEIAPVMVAFEAPALEEETAPVSVETPKLSFPLLPEYAPQQSVEPTIAPVVQEFAPVEAEAPKNASFEENFTYVPEPGETDVAKSAIYPADLAAIDEAVKLEVAQRAAELELENIWRLMLAKPTSDDRVTYLREAAEIHAADEEWHKPDAEHDLSNIAPAAITEEYVPSSYEATIDPIALPGEVVHLLPVAEGQDLAELTRSLLDMMAAGNASGLPQERALAADTLLRLVPRLEIKPLIMLAQRLAMMDSPPNLLVSRLIRDPRVEVAGPLLEDCSHITDKDLEQIIQEGELDKLRMIGRRRRLTRQISDALIKSGDPSVVLTLVRNADAEISHDGFLSLLLLCEHHEELLAPLATRQDLGAPFAFELFWLAPAQLRRFILSRFLTDSETLTKILKITKLANSEDEGEVEPMSQFALLEALERAARGHLEVAAEELAVIMQLSPSTVTRILSDLQGDAIVVMLKATAYPRSSMSGLLKRLQDAELPLISRDRDITELQSMFETLSFNKARILLTYWDWAQSKTGPYAPVH